MASNLRAVACQDFESSLFAVLKIFSAQIFDDIRGESQGPEHINQLFQKKTCEGVLQLGQRTLLGAPGRTTRSKDY